MIAGKPLALALAALALAACALSPQTVSIVPTLELAGMRSVGEGTHVALTVRDRRASPVVGHRGGVYRDTATLSTRGDVARAVAAELERALGRLGFEVVAAGEPADATLTVAIEGIGYATEGGAIMRSVRTSASVRAEAVRGGRKLTASYESEHHKQVLSPPDASENEALINTAVSQALERLLGDAELIDFLRGR